MTMTHCAVCGLYCKACTVYIATREDRERLNAIAKRRGISPDEMQCDGCRSDRRSAICRSCDFIACAKEKGVSFCNACERYPCEELKAFNRFMPHRAELFEDNERIRAVGWAVWQQEMTARYACKACGTLNSAYDLACRKCGTKPSNDFVVAHNAAIRNYFATINNREA